MIRISALTPLFTILLSFAVGPIALGGEAKTPGWRLNPSHPVCFTSMSAGSRDDALILAQMSPLVRGPVEHQVANETFRFDDREKRIIRETLEREYTLERTGFALTGFTDCPYDHQGYLMIAPMVSNRYNGYFFVGIGKGLVGVQPYLSQPIPANQPESMLTPEEQLAETVIHEVGHAAGMGHDFDRGHGGFVSYTKPDPQSIMSYVYMEAVRENGLSGTRPRLDSWIGLLADPELATIAREPDGRFSWELRIGLSQGDVHTLRCIYADRTGQDPAYCHDAFDPYASRRRRERNRR